MQPNSPMRPQRPDVFVPPRRPVQPQQPLAQPAPRPQPVPQAQPRHFEMPSDHRRRGNPILLTVIFILVLAFIAAAGYGGYYYATHIEKKQGGTNQQATNEQNSQTTGSNLLSGSNTSSVNDPIHYVSSAGSPYDLGGKKTFAVSLGLPSVAQGIRVQSYNNDRGQEQYYTVRYADEIARWSVGYPDLLQSTQSQVSVLAISKSWLSLKQNGNHAFDDTGVPLDTPAQKSAYIAKMSKDSQSCIKDKAKGFTTKDSVFSVCFSLIPGADMYTPVLVLHGYAEKEGQPLIMVGFIHLEDGQKYDKKTSQQILADAKKGKIPDSTVKLIDTYVSALSQTTVKAQ